MRKHASTSLAFCQSHEFAYLNAWEEGQVLCYICHPRNQWKTMPFVIVPQEHSSWPLILIIPQAAGNSANKKPPPCKTALLYSRLDRSTKLLLCLPSLTAARLHGCMCVHHCYDISKPGAPLKSKLVYSQTDIASATHAIQATGMRAMLIAHSLTQCKQLHQPLLAGMHAPAIRVSRERFMSGG